MNIGNEIQKIRSAQGLTQEAFGELFHVTRQAVSNWENGKTYPDLQTLVEISSRFDISLDTLLKADAKLVRTIDRERMIGTIKREKRLIDALTGAGTGIVVSCLFSPASPQRTVMIVLGMIFICMGWYKQGIHYQNVVRQLEKDC
ncbi:MAG: helix-turn-helix transcriptional regulator [Clostridia bacterium]|nr:helix-turn-helix transcriptional regulator [Clostridia bacterium]